MSYLRSHPSIPVLYYIHVLLCCTISMYFHSILPFLSLSLEKSSLSRTTYLSKRPLPLRMTSLTHYRTTSSSQNDLSLTIERPLSRNDVSFSVFCFEMHLDLCHYCMCLLIPSPSSRNVWSCVRATIPLLVATGECFSTFDYLVMEVMHSDLDHRYRHHRHHMIVRFLACIHTLTYIQSKCSVMGPEQLGGVIDIITREAAARAGRPVNEEMATMRRDMLKNMVRLLLFGLLEH